jgi:tRNA(fMet)-specific endonuclease VapC
VLLADRRRKARRAAYVDDIVAVLPVLAHDTRVAEAHAELLAVMREQGQPRGAHDLIIAATAKAFDRGC